MHHRELPGRVRRAAAHADRAASFDPGALPRHRLSLPGDTRLSRPNGFGVEPEPGEPAAQADGGAAGIAIRHPLSRRARSLLRHAESRAAVRRPGGLRHLVYGIAPRAIEIA